jgi:hypothetical protein
MFAERGVRAVARARTCPSEEQQQSARPAADRSTIDRIDAEVRIARDFIRGRSHAPSARHGLGG